MKSKLTAILFLFTIISSCKKEDEKTPVPSATTNATIYTDVYVLDSIVFVTGYGYADTIRVTADKTKTTAPTTYGINWGGTVTGTYVAWGDYFSFTSQLMNADNPNSGITGFYSFKGDTLDYVFSLDNATLNPNHKAFYLKLP